VLLLSGATGSNGQVIQVNVPDIPPAGTNTLTGSFQGYSMEVASFADIAGNLS
jgi:hypothetical protein